MAYMQEIYFYKFVFTVAKMRLTLAGVRWIELQKHTTISVFPFYLNIIDHLYLLLTYGI